MKSFNKSSWNKAWSLSILAFTLLFGHSAQADSASLTSAGYTQNFSSMGTGTTVPTGWSGVTESGSHYTFAPDVSNEYNDGNAYQNENFTAGTLSASSVEHLTPTQASSTGKGTDIINWSNTLATVANGEGSESLGTDPSGNSATMLELSLTNNTGSAITALNVSYDIDRFTTISDTNGSPSGYANSSVEEFPGYHLFYNLTPSNAATWVDVTALDPTINMGTTGAVQVPNTVGITTIPMTTVTLDGSVANGATIALAWFDDNGSAASPDQEIGLNNVSVSAAEAPEPSSLTLCFAGVAAVVFLVRRPRHA
jgi:hypothetical protein